MYKLLLTLIYVLHTSCILILLIITLNFINADAPTQIMGFWFDGDVESYPLLFKAESFIFSLKPHLTLEDV